MRIEKLDPDKLDTLVGMAKRIELDAEGRPWVVTKTNDLYRREGTIWRRLPVKLSDISMGASGAMWGLSDKGMQEGI